MGGAIAAPDVAAVELDRMQVLLDDPAFAISTPAPFTAWGRQP